MLCPIQRLTCGSGLMNEQHTFHFYIIIIVSKVGARLV